MKLLDTGWAFVYKRWLAALLGVAAAAMLSTAVSASAATYVLGLKMPRRVQAAGPNRYKLWKHSLRDILKFFKKRLKGISYKITEAIDHPKVRVIHIRSGSSSTQWEGVNISLRGNWTYLYVIPRKRLTVPGG